MVNKRNDLTIFEIAKIKMIFMNNGWLEKEMMPKSLFERYCHRYNSLKTRKQKNLFLDLTKRYLKIKSSEYLIHLINMLDKCLNSSEGLLGKESFILYPLAKQKDIDNGDIKSSSEMYYEMLSSEITSYLKKKKIKMKPCAGREHLSRMKKSQEKILLIDDYVGSGETALKCVDEMINNYNINKNRLMVGCMIVQKQGVEQLSKENIPIYYDIERNKGISDYYMPEVAEKNIDILTIAEEDLGIKKEFLGHNDCEGLITTNRTPNNTFPIFWENYDDNAPFPRY